MNTERIDLETLNDYVTAINASNGDMTSAMVQIPLFDVLGLLAEYVVTIGSYDVRITKPVREWAAERVANHDRKRFTDYDGRPLIYPALHHCHLDCLIKALLID